MRNVVSSSQSGLYERIEAAARSIAFDNREVTLKRLRVPNLGIPIYIFSWWSNGERMEYNVISGSAESAIEEFRDKYPTSRGCVLSETREK